MPDINEPAAQRPAIADQEKQINQYPHHCPRCGGTFMGAASCLNPSCGVTAQCEGAASAARPCIDLSVVPPSAIAIADISETSETDAAVVVAGSLNWPARVVPLKCARDLERRLRATVIERDEIKAGLKQALSNIAAGVRERDELRDLLQQSARHVFAHAAASHLTEGFRPVRNEWDELADKLRAKGFK